MGIGIWVFGGLILVSATIATFVGDIRRAILALWVCGLGAAGLFLSVGAEVVAVIQAIVATLMAIAALFHAITFGEYGRGDARPVSKRVVAAILPSLVGVGFAAVIWIGTRGLTPQAPVQVGNHDIERLGKALVNEHLLSLEILALTLLLTIVGSGVVARAEEDKAQ